MLQWLSEEVGAKTKWMVAAAAGFVMLLALPQANKVSPHPEAPIAAASYKPGGAIYEFCDRMLKPVRQFHADKRRYLYEHDGGPLTLEFGMQWDAAGCARTGLSPWTGY